MPPPSQVGQELLNVPFPEFVKNLALAIAEGQTALDQNSLETVKFLSENNVTLPAIPASTGGTSPTNVFPLIALGIPATFYQFTSAIISVKMAITMTISTEASGSVSGSAKFKAFSASVNASYSRKYEYHVEGASSLEVTLTPVPPPKALQDYIEAFIKASTQPTAIATT